MNFPNQLDPPSTAIAASRLGGQTGLVFAGYLFTLLVGFPLQIFVSRRLGAEGLGVFGLLEGLIGTLAGLIGFGLAPALVRFIPHHLERREFSRIRYLVRRGALLLLLGGALACIVFILVLPLSGLLWSDLARHRTLALVMSGLLPLSLLLFFLQQGLRGFQAMAEMTIGTSVLQLLTKAALSVLLLSLGLQVIGYAWAVLGSVAIACSWLGWRLWKRLAALPRDAAVVVAEQKHEWWRYARVMYANSLLGTSTQYADRFLLGAFAGAAPVGVLVVLAPLAQLPAMALTMLISVVAPMFSAAHSRRDEAELSHLYRISTDWAVRAALPLIVFLVMFSREVLLLYGEAFAASGVTAFRILLLGAALNLLTGPLGNFLNMVGHENAMFLLNVKKTILLVLAYGVLVPTLGLTGAALGLVASTSYAAWRGLALARTACGITWWDARYRVWLLPTAITLVVAMGLKLTGMITGAAWLALALAFLYVLFGSVLLFQGLSKDDRALLSYLKGSLSRVAWNRVRSGVR